MNVATIVNKCILNWFVNSVSYQSCVKVYYIQVYIKIKQTSKLCSNSTH